MQYSIGEYMHRRLLHVDGAYLQQPTLNTLRQVLNESRDFLWQQFGIDEMASFHSVPGYILIARLADNLQGVLSMRGRAVWNRPDWHLIFGDWLAPDDLLPITQQIFSVALSAGFLPHLEKVGTPPSNGRKLSRLTGVNLSVSFGVRE